MKHLTILVPEVQNNIITIAAIHEIFSTANAYWKETGQKELFIIELAGISEKVDFLEGLYSAKPHVNISAITKTDLVIIPSVSSHSYEKAVKKNRLLIDWIKQQYNNGAEVASMCTGAFILASSGLLDGRSCSTHWSAADDFKMMFPKVNLQTDKLITDENGIYTNGGAYSFLNLAIYLVEKYYDRQTAIFCSKIFQIEIDRQSQSPFVIFTSQKLHGDEMVLQAQEYIESKLHEKFSVEDLSARFAVGRRNFDRRFIKATGNTPGEYLQRVKIEAAKKSFETTRKTIIHVMREVGYSDVKGFRATFRRITGMSPLEYRSKYNNKNAVI
jgi:transcriptional regulator GlxA family with amidase domain